MMPFGDGPFGSGAVSSGLGASVASTALALVYASTFQTGLAASLARGGDVCLHSDSISSGHDADFNDSEQRLLRNLILDTYQNEGYESGYGYYSVGDPWHTATNTPTYFHTGTWTGTPVGNNYGEMITVRTNGANSQCRFSFPPTMDTRKIKRVELVFSTGPTTAPSITVDMYSVAAPLAPGDAYITAGTAGSITHSGLTGVSQVLSLGNFTNVTAYRTGVLNIVFNGATHNPVIQVTCSQDLQMCGIILHCDNHDYEGKGIRFHDFSVSGRQLLPTRSTQTPGSPDSYANNSTAFISWFRSWQMRIGMNGVSNSYSTVGPCCNTKLFILGLGVNDELLNGNNPYTYGTYCMDTVDAIMAANPQTYIILRQPYCPANICANWRRGYDSGGAGNMMSFTVNFTSYWGWIYAAQAKYPDRIAVVSYDRLLGEKTYAEAITAKGWNTGDDIHWKNGGPAWGVSQIKKILPAKTEFLLSSGLKSNSLTTSCTQAVRFDRFEAVPNHGSLGGTWSANTGANPALRASRTSNNLSFTMNINTNSSGYGFVYSANVAPPQTDYTLFMRIFLASSPPSGQAYICSLYGDEGGSASNWQLRIGNGSAPTALKLDGVSTGSVTVGQWVTVAKVRVGTTVTYYIDGVASGTGTEAVPANTSGTRRLADITGASGRPLTQNSKVSHVLEWGRALSAGEIATVHANPDDLFTLA